MSATLLTRIGAQLGDTSLLQPSNRLAAIRLMALGLVWLTIASGGVALTDPTPMGVLATAAILILPAVGLVSIKPILLVVLSLLLVVGASGLIASTQAMDMGKAVAHCAVGLYLSVTFFVLAAFIAKRPAAHTQLIMHAYVCAAVIASTVAILWSFTPTPHADELTATLARTSGTLNKSDVFGPFLVPPLIYVIHLALNRPLRSALLCAGLALLMAFAFSLGFSQGAWINLAISGTVYAFLHFATAPTHVQRLKLILITAVGIVALATLVVTETQHPLAWQSELKQAQSVVQHLAGTQGQLIAGGQATAAIPLNPLGVGTLQYGSRHYEPVHNVYLSVMLRNGWIGGLVFVMIMIISLFVGFAFVIRRAALQPMMIIVFSAFVGLAAQGLTSDIQDWRHMCIVMAVLWGLIASHQPYQMAADASGPNTARDHLDLLSHWHSRLATPRDQRPATIVGPGRVTISAFEPQERRSRPHRPRRPQCAAHA